MGANEKLNLERFADCYIQASFDILKSNPDIKLDNFDISVRAIVSDELKISVEDVKELHHPFHHIFFCDGDISPLRLEACLDSGNFHYKVLSKREISEDDLRNIANYILLNPKTKEYLQAKINALYKNGRANNHSI